MNQEIKETKQSAGKKSGFVERLAKKSPLCQKIATVLAFVFAVGNLMILAFYPLKPWIHLPLVLGIATILIVLKDCGLFIGKVKFLQFAFNILIVVFVISALFYYSTYYEKLIMRPAMPKNLDLLFATMLTIGCVEASRRVNRTGLTVVAISFLLYSFFGHYFPGALGHAYYRPSKVFMTLFSDTGVFSSPLEVSVTSVFLFILFSEFLNRLEAAMPLLSLPRE